MINPSLEKFFSHWAYPKDDLITIALLKLLYFQHWPYDNLLELAILESVIEPYDR